MMFLWQSIFRHEAFFTGLNFHNFILNLNVTKPDDSTLNRNSHDFIRDGSLQSVSHTIGNRPEYGGYKFWSSDLHLSPVADLKSIFSDLGENELVIVVIKTVYNETYTQE
jgi:predicted alpha-1,6-mannanase (GH76 family)